MKVRVVHSIGDLASDMAEIPVKFKTRAPQVVEWNVQRGLKIAQRLARERSGPHGKSYWKRLDSEMLSPLSGEYGPHGGGTPVGGGYRTDGPNLDLPNSADLIGGDFADDMGDLVGRLFREAGF